MDNLRKRVIVGVSLCALACGSAGERTDNLKTGDAAKRGREADGGTTPIEEEEPSSDSEEDAPASADAGLPALQSRCGTLAGLQSFALSNLPPDFALMPAANVRVSGKCTLDTDTLGWIGCSDLPEPSVVALANGEAALLVVESFESTTTAELHLRGQRPFILVAAKEVVHRGSIDTVPSPTNGWSAGGAPGPSTPTRRGIGPGGGSAAVTGTMSIGAEGGTFCGRGGLGTGMTASSVEPYGTPDLVPLVAGSSGGSGNYGGTGAGGAIQISAGTSITISETGVIAAVGASSSGYSAGSSGGAILLEAPEVTLLGVLSTNGAGGGAAAITYVSQAGTRTTIPAEPGRDGNVPARNFPGQGSAGSKLDGSPGTGMFAPGGGGVGRIRINASCEIEQSGVVTPSAGTPCYSEGALAPR